MRKEIPALALACGLGLLGCRSKITSSITINGAPLAPNSCRNGEALGFHGVELSSGSGARLRIVSTPMGQGAVYYFPGAASSAQFMGLCGPLTIERQNSRINNVYNVRGNATLNCTGLGGTVAGTVNFENCH